MNISPQPSIGWIGLGLMGRPMVARLHAAGWPLRCYCRNPERAAAMTDQGIPTAESPRELAAQVDWLVLCVADTPAVESVLFGESGAAEGLASGARVIDMGTTAVAATRGFAARLAEQGVDYLDAPVSGGVGGATDGSLSIMLGGGEQSVAATRAMFEVLGQRLTHVGGVGAGQVAKAANQVIVGLNIEAVAEALALAARAGCDPARVHQALRGGFADSRILEVHGQRMLTGDYTPGGKVTTQLKDLRQALELAESLDLDLPATRLCADAYARLAEAGDGALDHSALMRLYGARVAGE